MSPNAVPTPLPGPLEELVEEFAAVPERDRLQLLLELSYELPELPAEFAEHRDRLEPVPECQSPLFLAVELTAERRVRLVFDAPAEAPTTRGFASILHQGLSGLPADEVLAVPDTFYLRLGLGAVVSPLRTRGMAAMLARAKRQIRALLAATATASAPPTSSFENDHVQQGSAAGEPPRTDQRQGPARGAGVP